MRILSVLSLSCALLFGIASSAVAGDGPHQRGRHDPEKRLARLTDELGLSVEQQDELRPILEAQAERFVGPRERRRAGESREEIRAAMRSEHATRTAEIEAVLNPEQVAKYQQLQAEREERFRKKHEQRRKRHGENAAPSDDTP